MRLANALCRFVEVAAQDNVDMINQTCSNILALNDAEIVKGVVHHGYLEVSAEEIKFFNPGIETTPSDT